jgi:uncharacterized protein (DUF302 family)
VYAKTVKLALPYDEAVLKVKDVFKEKGFGTLTEIDVRSALKERLGVEVEPYLIIGACNPVLAKRALEAEPEVGTLLPCNIVVRKVGDQVVVHVFDPAIMASISGNPEVTEVAREAERLVEEALSSLGLGERSELNSK